MAGVAAVIPKVQFNGSNGAPLANGTVDVYVAGTTTRTDTWQDKDLTVLNTNPIQLDSRGECLLWLDGDKTYKFVLKNSGGATQWTVDNVSGAAGAASLVMFTQSGTGAVARTAQDKMRDVISSADYCACDGETDDAAQWAKLMTAAAGKTVLIVGTIGTNSTLEIPNGVDILCHGTIKALAGFSGSYVVSTDLDTAYNKGTVNGLRIDGNGLSVKGLHVRQAQTSYFNDTFVHGCLDTGIHVAAGYEVFLNRFQILGAASGMVSAAPGLLAVAGDCHYSDGVVTLYPIGVKASGGNCRFTRVHPWGVYTTGSTPMLHGFWCTGEGNTFTDCSPDSPDCADRGVATSLANGGYGFYVDSTAISSSFRGCKLIVASHANAPTSLLKFGYVSGSFCSFIDCRIDDNSGAAMADSLQFVSGARSRETTIMGPGLSGYTSVSGKFWLQDMYGTFTPDMKFGGTEIGSGGGTYFSGRRTGYYYRIGPLIYFVIHIRLASKGSATGAVTVSLPSTYYNFGNVQAWPVEVQFTNNVINAYGRIFVNTNSISLYDVATGSALTDASIGANQEVYISGMFPVGIAP